MCRWLSLNVVFLSYVLLLNVILGWLETWLGLLVAAALLSVEHVNLLLYTLLLVKIATWCIVIESSLVAVLYNSARSLRQLLTYLLI